MGFAGWLTVMVVLGLVMRPIISCLKKFLGSQGTDVKELARLSSMIKECRGRYEKLPQQGVALELAKTLVQRGNRLAEAGRRREGERDYIMAVDLYKLWKQGSERVEATHALIGTLNNLGMLQRDELRLAQSIETFDRALAVAKECPEQYHLRSVVLNNRGIAKLRLRNLNDAIADFTKSIDVGHAACNDDQDGRRTLALVEPLNNRGGVFSEMGKESQALDDYETAIGLCRSVLSYSTDAQARWWLARCLENRGRVLHRLGRLDDAKRDFEEAERIQGRGVGS